MEPTVSTLLLRMREGDTRALPELVAFLYDELHRLARRQLRGERADHTLRPTALLHEAFLRLNAAGLPYADRTHFLAVAARVMRNVLVDYARTRAAQKRDVAQALHWTACLGTTSFRPADLLDLDRALEALAVEEPSLASLVEMHYFGGMTAEECAEVRNCSAHVLRHDIRLARAWLRRKLAQS